MSGNLSAEEIELLLTHQFIGRIGCHAQGTTYVVPLSYTYDGAFIYAHSQEGLKIRLMRENSKVCFEVDDTRSLGNWRSVIAFGEYEELKDPEERNEGINKLEQRLIPMQPSNTMKLTQQWPFPAGDQERIDGIIFRIRLVEKSGRFEKSDGGAFIPG